MGRYKQDNATLGIQRRADHRRASEHAIGAKAHTETIDMRHAVEDRQDHCVWPYRRGEVLHGFIEGIGLCANQDDVIGFVNVAGSDRWCRNSEIAVRADYLQTPASELLRAMRSHQESYVAPGTQEAAAEVSSQSACPDHQDAHGNSQSLVVASLKAKHNPSPVAIQYGSSGW